MKWTERLAEAVRAGRPSRDQGIRDALAAGRTAKFAESYETALTHLDHALELAHDQRQVGEVTAITAVGVHRAEVLMRLRRFDEAAAFIETLQQSVPDAAKALHTAYLDCMRGLLSQAQGDLISARSAYESALRGIKAAKTQALPGPEGRALGHLADLYLREGNASYAAKLLRDALPLLSASSDIELSSYFVGLLGQAMTINGQESEGLHFIQRAFTLAEQFRYRLYERHWGLILGKRALDEGRYLDARTHYQRILHLFDPQTPTPAYVIVQAGLSKAAVYLRDLPNAVACGENATAALEHLAEPPIDPPVALVTRAACIPLAQGALGMALRASGRGAEAITNLESAVGASGEIASRDQVDLVRALAAAYADTGRLDDAIRTYTGAIHSAERLDDPLEAAQCRRDLGLVYQRAGRSADAAQEWTAALAIYTEKSAYAQIARLYCDLGGLRRAMGYTARALKDYEQALMALNNIDSSDLETRGLVLSNAANLYAEMGDAESADAFFSESIQIAEKMGDKTADSTRSGNYGWFLILVGRPRRAITTLERALRLSDANGLALQAAVQTDNLGLAHDALGEYTAALTQHEKAIALIDPAVHPYWHTSFTINLANTLLSLARMDEARTLITTALETGRTLQDMDLIIRGLTAQARAALLAEQHTDAAPPLEEAIQLARRLESRRLLADLLYLRSQQQSAAGDETSARAAWEEAQKLYTILHMPQAKIHPFWLETAAHS
ncbi:MAG: hypothetical protein SF162_18235 [bacterium]|nr:hypothetical protein [bacterium]